LVLLFAWETLFPTMGPFPVTWHTRAIMFPLQNSVCLNFGKDRDSMRKQGLRSNLAALSGQAVAPD
jgi:hypothetical protein